MANLVKAHFTTNALNKLLYGVERIAKKVSAETAETCLNYAKNNLADAEYDGVNDVEIELIQTGPRSWEVVAKGESAAFIEFGTGKQSPNAGIYGPRGLNEGWSFKEKEGTTYTAGGGELYTLIEQSPKIEKTPILNPVTGKPAMKRVKKNGVWVQVPAVRVREIPQAPREVKRPGYGFTRGNKANYFLTRSFEQTRDELPKIAVKAVKK